MPRKLKPYKVSDFQFQDGSRGEVYLDRDRKDFFADVGKHVARADSEQGCVAQAKMLWDSAIALDIEWKKIIVARLSESRWSTGPRETDRVSLSYSVREVGETPSGKWMTRTKNNFFGNPRSSSCNHRYDQEEYGGATENNERDGVYVLEWSEEVEASLKAIKAAIQELGSHLNKLLNADDAHERLVGYTLSLMPKRDSNTDA